MSRAALLLQQARLYADDRFVPIALGVPDNPALALEMRQKAAKVPAKGVCHSQITLDNWEQHWPPGHALNIGIRTGPESEVVGVDIDVKDGGLERWQQLVAEHGEWRTATVRSARGGFHKYAFFGGPAATLKQRTKVGEGGAGIDIRNVNGYLVAPPSALPEAGTYVWVGGEGPGDVTEMPAWVFEEVSPKAEPPPPAAKARAKGRPRKEAPAAPPPPEAVPPPGQPPPKLGQWVSVDGEARRLDCALVRDVLSYVPPPRRRDGMGRPAPEL